MKVFNISGFSKVLAALLLSALLTLIIFSGCSKTLDGVVNANQKPIVSFVNIPPGLVIDSITGDTLRSYTRFSRNPFIYWYGSDVDGQIDYFRYTVVTEPELGGMTPDEYGAVVLQQDDIWTVLDVSASEADPHTTEIVSLKALSEDPVNFYLVQFVYVQAFDEEGLASDLIYRGFSRNDSPPNTLIGFIPPTKKFINSVEEGIITGVSLSWSASDPDYPVGDDAPPFEFQWRLYGPYEDFNAKRSEFVFKDLMEKFQIDIFATLDAKVYRIGDTLITCDTAFQAGGAITCDTLEVGKDDLAIVRGSWQKLFDVDALELDPFYNRLVWQSDGWTTATDTTLFNVYLNDTSGVDTTVEQNFLFWVKSRDDAFVEDLVPAYDSVRVIQPRFERAILVVDFSFQQINYPRAVDTSANVWKGFIDNWGQRYVPGWDENSFMTGPRFRGVGPDYVYGVSAAGVPLASLLKHKVVILYDDEVIPYRPSFFNNIYGAIDAGVNVWASVRAPLIGGQTSIDMWGISVASASPQYAFYFAADRISYSGWLGHTRQNIVGESGDTTRIEHFVRASSLFPEKWPSLPIDTALLHQRYNWPPLGELNPAWRADIAALPEVNWMSFVDKSKVGGVEVRAEPMYLYGSKYGQNGHPKGGLLAEYHGSPVAHRVKASYFKTVHFMFTPLALNPDSFQIITDTVLNYLYEPDLASPVSKNRYFGSE